MRIGLLDRPDKEALPILANIKRWRRTRCCWFGTLFIPIVIRGGYHVYGFGFQDDGILFGAGEDGYWVGLFKMAGFVVRHVYRPEGLALLPVAA